jgi:hypothetical protein
MRFGTWNVRMLDQTGNIHKISSMAKLIIVHVRKLSPCKVDPLVATKWHVLRLQMAGSPPAMDGIY